MQEVRDQSIMIFGKHIGSTCIGGPEILQLGTDDSRTRGSVTGAPEAGILLTADEPRGELRNGRVRIHECRGGVVSGLLHGAALTALALSPTIRYVFQMVSIGITYPNLEGPVFGIRVGTSHVNNLGDPLSSAAPTDKLEGDSSGTGSPYKVVLYKLPCGAIEERTFDGHPSNKRLEGTLNNKFPRDLGHRK